MKFNCEVLLDYINQYNDADALYHKAAADYRKKHGVGAYLDIRAGLNPEKERIYHASIAAGAALDAEHALFEAAGIAYDADAMNRAYIAARALREWHDRDGWQHCTPAALVDQLTAFIDGTGRQ